MLGRLQQKWALHDPEEERSKEVHCALFSNSGFLLFLYSEDSCYILYPSCC